MLHRVNAKGRFQQSVISLVACSFFATLSAYAADTPPSPVEIDTVTEVSLAATADLMGTVHSRSYVNITASVNGRLEWLQEPGVHGSYTHLTLPPTYPV